MSFGTDVIEELMGNLLNLNNQMQEYETQCDCEIKELTDKMHEHLGIIQKQKNKIFQLQMKLDNPLHIKADKTVFNMGVGDDSEEHF